MFILYKIARVNKGVNSAMCCRQNTFLRLQGTNFLSSVTDQGVRYKNEN